MDMITLYRRMEIIVVTDNYQEITKTYGVVTILELLK